MRFLICCWLGALTCLIATPLQAELHVGAAAVDISPNKFPVLVNGGMTSRQASEVTSPLYARAIVVSEGETTFAMVVVDSCMLPRPLLDDAKQIAARRTGIPHHQILISATHTHTAPSSMGCLGTRVDEAYVPFLRDLLAQSIEKAHAQRQPAQVGWAVVNAADYTATRRWIYRSDRVQEDPFGNKTVRANMHAGGNWDNVTGPSGPEDPDVSMIAFQTLDGKPLALLANFSMHYFSGVKALHPDYFGVFCKRFEERVAQKADEKSTSFVAVMSHGCSGDIWRKDYELPPEKRNDQISIDEFTDGLLELTWKGYDKIAYEKVDSIAVQEQRMALNYRVPNKQLLEWSKRIAAEVGDRDPKTREEVYALEQVILDKLQSTEIVVQAYRIGDIAIATTPNETYALTGLKIKLQSPLAKTMVIELANGGDGYIPPPEQHLLGGYNTWPARSAGLEVFAEPKITETALQLLEKVSQQPRKKYSVPTGKLAQATLDLKPVAYWRLDEFSGNRAIDASGHGQDGVYEPGIAYFLEGPQAAQFSDGNQPNRAIHVAGGRIDARLPALQEDYTISFWVWNGMPNEGRDVTGWLLGRGRDFSADSSTEHLGIAGTGSEPGKLMFQQGNSSPVLGQTVLERWKWNQVVLVRQGKELAIYLNGNPEPEIKVQTEKPTAAEIEQFYFGGRADRNFGFEGRLDEVAIFDRALTGEEIQQLTPSK